MAISFGIIAPKKTKKALESIQLDAAWITTGATKVCSVQKLYNETGYETLQERRKKQKLCQMYKITHNSTPDYLKQLLPPRIQEQTRYSLRNPNNFIVPITRTTFHFNSYLPSSLREWNSLNTASRNSSSLVSFKRTLNNKSIIVPPYFYTIQTSRIGQVLHIRIRLE